MLTKYRLNGSPVTINITEDMFKKLPKALAKLGRFFYMEACADNGARLHTRLPKIINLKNFIKLLDKNFDFKHHDIRMINIFVYESHDRHIIHPEHVFSAFKLMTVSFPIEPGIHAVRMSIVDDIREKSRAITTFDEFVEKLKSSHRMVHDYEESYFKYDMISYYKTLYKAHIYDSSYERPISIDKKINKSLIENTTSKFLKSVDGMEEGYDYIIIYNTNKPVDMHIFYIDNTRSLSNDIMDRLNYLMLTTGIFNWNVSLGCFDDIRKINIFKTNSMHCDFGYKKNKFIKRFWTRISNILSEEDYDDYFSRHPEMTNKAEVLDGYMKRMAKYYTDEE